MCQKDSLKSFCKMALKMITVNDIHGNTYTISSVVYQGVMEHH